MSLIAEAPPADPGVLALPEEGHPSGSPGVGRDVLGAVSAALVAIVMVQRWGLLAHDTRFDLLLDPQGFLSATWHLWDPSVDMGRLQNQAVGYLFPMGPFMLVGAVLQIPPWVVERGWIAALLVAAFWGMVRLLESLRIGSPTARVVAALSFALSPFFIARVGNISVFVQGAAFMPWALRPLVEGSRAGSPRRAAAASGLAVLFMGGVNAVVVAAALVPSALWLLTRQRGPRRAALARWWALAVVLATAWWAVPLAYQARYGFDFLPVTERAGTTTAFTPPFEVLRGVADWLSYLPSQTTSMMAGAIETSAGLVIAAGALVVALGLHGLARRSTPERRFLVLCLVVGVVLVGAGFGGALGNPLAPQVRALLEGPLGLFRNVYKFAPLVLLPLAAGVAVGLDHLGALAAARRARSRRTGAGTGPAGSRAVAALVVALVLLAAWPLLGGDLLNHRAFAEEPAWWEQAKAFAESEPGRTLIVPGLPQSGSSWGYTAEEPFEWGTSASWASRGIVPLGSVGATRVLDTVEAAIERGGTPALASYLRRAGFSTVLVRNDGDWEISGAPSPLETTLAVQASGLEPVASFGPAQATSTEVGLSGLRVHPIDVYRVPDAASVSPVSVSPVAATAEVSGDPGTLMELDGTALADRPLLLATDAAGTDTRPTNLLVTDGNQRTFTSFGLNRLNRSYVLTPDDPAPDGADLAAGFLPTDRVEDQTVARRDIAELAASSYGSWPFSLPEVGPQQAVDGDPSTAWASAAGADPEQQWIELRLPRPVTTGSVLVRLLEDGPWRPVVRRLTITTDAGSLTAAVHPDESLQRVPVPAGPMTWLRIGFADVVVGDATTGPGIRDIAVPGIDDHQRLAVPDQPEPPGGTADPRPTSYLFTRLTANPTSLLRSDTETELRRVWSQPAPADLQVGVTVTAVRGDELLRVLGTNLVSRVSASSTLGDLPSFAVSNLFDGDPTTIWVAGAAPADPTGTVPPDAASLTGTDAHPTIRLLWVDSQTLTGLHLDAAGGYARPTSVRLTSDTGEVREAPVDDDGNVRFEPLTANRIDLGFPTVSRAIELAPGGGQTERPLGLAGISGDWTYEPGRVRDDTPVVIPCGRGPSITIDDRKLDVAVDTTVGALESFQPVAARVCDTAPVAAAPGEHTLDTSRSLLLAVRAVRLDPQPSTTASSPPAERTVEVADWSSDHRSVRVGPGEEAYLAVAENANAGWSASLDGRALAPVTLDGWKQGFVVPSGAGGEVTLSYTPTTGYRLALVAGALLVLALLALWLAPARRPEPPAVAEGRPARGLLVAVVVLAGVALGGPLVLAVVPLLVLGRRRPGALAAVAGGAFVVAGLVVGATVRGAAGGAWGAFGGIATVCSVVAFLAVAVSVLLPDAADVPAAAWWPRPLEASSTDRPPPEEEHDP